MVTSLSLPELWALAFCPENPSDLPEVLCFGVSGSGSGQETKSPPPAGPPSASPPTTPGNSGRPVGRSLALHLSPGAEAMLPWPCWGRPFAPKDSAGAGPGSLARGHVAPAPAAHPPWPPPSPGPQTLYTTPISSLLPAGHICASGSTGPPCATPLPAEAGAPETEVPTEVRPPRRPRTGLRSPRRECGHRGPIRKQGHALPGSLGLLRAP